MTLLEMVVPFVSQGSLALALVTVVNSRMMKPRSAQNKSHQRNQPSDEARQVNIHPELSLSS
jgi:hypothetical protein